MKELKNAIVIGAGFSGLSAASFLAKRGYNVTIIEKNSTAGGRARKFHEQGFTFDMGPSWYWMPDVFDRYFDAFGKKTSDYYDLIRLSPSYRVFFENNKSQDIPSSITGLYDLFEKIEPGSSDKLKQFLKEAEYKYQVGMRDLVYKPGKSIIEYFDRRVIKGIFKLHVFESYHDYVRKYFKDPRLIQLLEFPVLFLGAQPKNIPALYSLMNYSDMVQGTWYPKGGMHKIIDGMVHLAEELGVKIMLNETVKKIVTAKGTVKKIVTNSGDFEADVIVGGADYHHIEHQLLDVSDRSYSEKYWDKRTMAPSCIIFYLGVDKKIKNLLHHNLFFDANFEKHAKEIYENPQWPSDPLFYVSVTSKTDDTVAPKGCENLFILVPVAPGLSDSESIRQEFFNKVMTRLEKLTGESIINNIVYRKDYAHNNFVSDYNSYKGNAYGLANTLDQTAVLKPKIKSKKVNNLYFTGQLTVPGPGVPPSLISGEVVAKQIIHDLKTN